MKREQSQDKETKSSKQEEDKGERSEKRPKYSAGIDKSDLGAGYDGEENTRVVRAIKVFETKLLPYIEGNPNIFKHSNFVALKGYGVGIPSTPDQ